MTDRPRIEGAPGLIWRRRKDGWEAIWRARADLVERGYYPKNLRLWVGETPTETEAASIADSCQRQQDDMLAWGRGGAPFVQAFDGTLKSLIQCYQADPDSTWHKKRIAVRRSHAMILVRVIEAHGDTLLPDIKARLIMSWHKEWSGNGQKLSMGHSFVGQLRALFTFGATLLEDPDCERLCGVMHKLRFPMGKPRTERLTAQHAETIRAKAHEAGWHSMALAQAFQFDLMLRQKDVIGEWVPLEEPGVSDVTSRMGKWILGLRWSEIDDDLILRHVTSKKGKPLEVDLKLAPMVMAELDFTIKFLGDRPRTGPVIIQEPTGIPWSAIEFRRKWRRVADMAGVPKSIKNMDSRAGGISEADEADINLEHVRKAATHSDLSMTQKYSRAVRESADNVIRARAEHRNKGKTSDQNG